MKKQKNEIAGDQTGNFKDDALNISQPIIAKQSYSGKQESTVSANQDTDMPSGISHSFDTGYAMAYGVEEAIVIRNLQFFITANANRGLNFHEGRFWTYDRLEDFPKHFPYWTMKQLRRIIISLIDQGVIVTGHFNQHWSNRTRWFAFKDQDKFIKHISPPKTPLPENIDLPKRANGSCPDGQPSSAQMGKCTYSTSSIAISLSSESLLKVPKGTEERVDKISPESFSSEVLETGQLMIEGMRIVKPDYSANNGKLLGMLVEIDRMIRLDKRAPDKIIEVFRWALSDSFWADKVFKPNPAKYLRDRFDQLEMKMNAKPPEQKKDRKFLPSSDDAEALRLAKEMASRAI